MDESGQMVQGAVKLFRGACGSKCRCRKRVYRNSESSSFAELVDLNSHDDIRGFIGLVKLFRGACGSKYTGLLCVWL